MPDLRHRIPAVVKDRLRPAVHWRRTQLLSPREARALHAAVAAGDDELATCRDELDGARHQIDALKRQLDDLRLAAGSVAPGHYYSPVPTPEDAAAAASRDEPELLPGIDLRLADQLALAATLGELAHDQPFAAEARPGLRYKFDNGFFGFDDGLVLHTMLRHLRPARVIEVGSGWSSACMLDTDERFLGGTTELTFIDPEPERLESILRGDEVAPRVTIHRCRVQDVDPALFGALRAGDVLFVDSSHVVKAGSDVLQLALDVVPTLPAGTFVHIHDIPWPFEYPLVWAEERRWWSEAYLVRALLCDSDRLRIRWFNSYLRKAVNDDVAAVFPFTGEGLSLWLEVVGDPAAPGRAPSLS